MDTDQILATSMAELEQVLARLDESAKDIDIMRDGIRTTLEQGKMRMRVRNSRSTTSNGAAPHDLSNLDGLTNAEVVSKFLSATRRDVDFNSVSSWNDFEKQIPGRLSKRQFQAGFAKLAKRKKPNLVLVEVRPSNVPNIYRWIENPEDKSRSGGQR
jgi:hypothetical protein